MSHSIRIRLAIGVLAVCAVLNVRLGLMHISRMARGTRPEERLAARFDELRTRLPPRGCVSYAQLPTPPGESSLSELSPEGRLSLARMMLSPLVVVQDLGDGPQAEDVRCRIRETDDAAELWVIEPIEATVTAAAHAGGRQ